MGDLLLGFFAVIVLAVAGFWAWLILGIKKPGIRGLFGSVAAQVSAIAMIYTGLRGADAFGWVTSALAPPFLLIELDRLQTFHGFLASVYPYALATGAIVAVPFIFLPKQWRRWWLAPSLLATITTGVYVGERVSQEAMCRTADAEGIGSFRRHSLLWSLANAPQEFQFEIHAAAERAGERLGWSYREMGWYVIPTTAWGEVEEPPFVCP